MTDDKELLKRAIDIAASGLGNGGGPFGAVIARDGTIISESYNMVVLKNDPTAHAEILAIRQAAALEGTWSLDEYTLYTSCEPCPMCLGAIYWAGIKKVVYASDRIDAHEAGFSDKIIYEEMMLEPGRRKITFLRLGEEGGEEVFRKWEKLETKVSY